ncbi:MAG: GNAT family N-acetyltransferase [Candidatus Levybacteria bacterium]|nr:GNAT family N-acetyltransferase [Candidatus Levybacteria bacterium]
MVNLRQATKKDLRILSEIYTIAYNSIDIGERWTSKSAYELIEFLYNDQPDLFFVADEEDKVVGAIVATVRPWWDGNHLIEGEIFVHPKHQKKGIGVKLIEKLFTTAKEKYSVVSWDTYTHKVYKNPLAWYKSLGFEEIKNWTMITGNISKVLKIIKRNKTY